jgi:hypothetical protein
MAFWMAFRTPTLLKSTDLQRGQQVENISVLQKSINYARNSEQGENDSCGDLRFPGTGLLTQFALPKPRAPDLFVEYSRRFGYCQHRCVHIRPGAFSRPSETPNQPAFWRCRGRFT